MNPEQLKEYKREKSKKFNANLRELRLKDKEKKRTADQQPDNQGTAQGSNQDDNQRQSTRRAKPSRRNGYIRYQTGFNRV